MITDGVVLTVSAVFPVVEKSIYSSTLLKNNCADLSTSGFKIYSHHTMQDCIMKLQ